MLSVIFPLHIMSRQYNSSSCKLTINGHEKDLLWFDLQEQVIDIVENGEEDLVFGQTEVGIGVVW